MICILSMGRSGSSMVANILHDAGVWFGKCRRGDHCNLRGYFENNAIKQRIYQVYGRDWLGGSPTKKLNVDDILEAEGYEGGPWAVKYGAFYARIWEDPFYVRVYRPVEKILASYARCGWLKPYNAPSLIAKHMKIMDGIDGFRIDADRLVEGDRTQMDELAGLLNLEFSYQSINPEFWH